jgi:hypothetical protein
MDEPDVKRLTEYIADILRGMHYGTITVQVNATADSTGVSVEHREKVLKEAALQKKRAK